MVKIAFKNQNAPCDLQKVLLEMGLRLPYNPISAETPDSYHANMRSRYYSFWENLPLKPEELVSSLTEGILGGEDDLVLKELYIEPSFQEGETTGFKFESKFVPYRDLNDHGNYTYLFSDREYDFCNGTCLKGDVRSSGLKQRGLGRRAVRNALQLGYALGCPETQISTTRVGALLWLRGDAYHVTDINPRYIHNIRSRWTIIEPYMDHDISSSIREAIKERDLKKLASYVQNIRGPLIHTDAGAHGHSALSNKEGDIPLNRYLLFDYLKVCWQGRSNMNDLQQRAELGDLLGGWSADSFELCRKSISSNIIKPAPKL
jgi:hypothetical protein